MKKILVILAAVSLIIPVALADMNINQTLISDGDITSRNYLRAKGEIAYYINGVNISAYDSERLLGLENYVSENNQYWSRDSTGMDEQDIFSVLRDAINYMLGIGRNYKDYEKDIGLLLFNTFIPRTEFNEYYTNIDFRLSVIEDYLARNDPEGFCMSALNNAKEYGYKKITCNNRTYTLTDNQAINIKTK